MWQRRSTDCLSLVRRKATITTKYWKENRGKIAIEILTLYRLEMSSASFAKQLKSNPDKTLVKNISSIENGQELDIEDIVNLVFNEATKYLQK